MSGKILQVIHLSEHCHHRGHREEAIGLTVGRRASVEYGFKGSRTFRGSLNTMDTMNTIGCEFGVVDSDSGPRKRGTPTLAHVSWPR